MASGTPAGSMHPIIPGHPTNLVSPPIIRYVLPGCIIREISKTVSPIFSRRVSRMAEGSVGRTDPYKMQQTKSFIVRRHTLEFFPTKRESPCSVSHPGAHSASNAARGMCSHLFIVHPQHLASTISG